MRADREPTKEGFIEEKNRLLKERKDIESLINDNQDSSDNWLELAEKFLGTAFYARDVLNGEDQNKK